MTEETNNNENQSEKTETEPEATATVETKKVTIETVAEENSAEPKSELEEELSKAKKEIENLKDSWLRERAEFQNYKKRTASEFIQIQKESIKSFVLKLLNPLDNLDRVTSVEVKEEVKPFLDGIEMIKKEIYSVLEKDNIYKVSPLNQPFDPMTMEALSAEESEQYTEEIVIEVYQPGFEYREENQSYILRPSRVRIGKPL